MWYCPCPSIWREQFWIVFPYNNWMFFIRPRHRLFSSTFSRVWEVWTIWVWGSSPLGAVIIFNAPPFLFFCCSSSYLFFCFLHSVVCSFFSLGVSTHVWSYPTSSHKGRFLAGIFHGPVYMFFSTTYWFLSSRAISSKGARFSGARLCHSAEMSFAIWRFFTHEEWTEKDEARQ